MRNKEEIYFSKYENTKNWKIINNFTIYEGKNLSDRPYMQTKVPKRLWLDLQDIRVVDAYYWGVDNRQHTWVDDDGKIVTHNSEQEREAKFTCSRYITARATFDDTITVFSIAEGAIMQFSDIANIRISGAPPEMIGGRNKATLYHGLGFSGRSSQEVPEKGLMEGEPGGLYLLNDSYPERRINEEPKLSLELFIDEPEFEALFGNMIANLDRIEKAKLNTLMELFENEVQATFNEPWMSSEYGLLKDEGELLKARASARIDGIQIVYSKPRLTLPELMEKQPIDTGFDEGKTLERGPNVVTLKDEALTNVMRSVSSRLSWVITILLAMAVYLALRP